MSIGRWVDFALSTERDQAACRSWCSLLVKPEEKLILAQGYETDDGSIRRVRLLIRRASGNLSEVTRGHNKRTWTLKAAPPSTDIIKQAEERGLLSGTIRSVGGVG